MKKDEPGPVESGNPAGYGGMAHSRARLGSCGRLRDWARRLKREVRTLLLVAKHPDLPWYVRLLAGLVLAYAFSPIDLIPDFIPVLGYLDDLILLPLGITLCIRLTPPRILAECRARAGEEEQAAVGETSEVGGTGGTGGTRRRSRLGMWLVIGVWIVLSIIILWGAGFSVFRWRFLRVS